jgi:hypothetical protein
MNKCCSTAVLECYSGAVLRLFEFIGSVELLGFVEII